MKMLIRSTISSIFRHNIFNSIVNTLLLPKVCVNFEAATERITSEIQVCTKWFLYLVQIVTSFFFVYLQIKQCLLKSLLHL